MSSEPITVCFDWGGVLLRICRSWEEGCEAAGLDVRPRGDDPDAHQRRQAFVHAFQIGEIEEREFFRRIADTTGGSYTSHEIERIHHAWLLGEYPGASELVASLSEHPGVRTALLSNTNAAHWRRQQPSNDGLSHFPAAGMVDLPHASHLMRCAKPDASIYRAFEQSVGADASSIVFFDDLGENIAAARAAGWRAIQVDHTGDTVRQMRLELHQIGITL